MIKFNVKLSDDTYRVVGELAGLMDGTMADVIREALSVFWWVASEYRQGNQLMIRRGDQITELMVPSLERLRAAAPAKTGIAPDDHTKVAAPTRRRRGTTARG
jgi:hypothetical protein